MYNPTGQEAEILRRLDERMEVLRQHRRNIGGTDLEKLWKLADDESIPHEYNNSDLKKWQSRQSGGMVFEKINTALSVIVDQNPEATLVPFSKQYQAKNDFMKALWDYSWQWKNNGPLSIQLFTHNLAKYGWAAGRHYHRYEEREVRDLSQYDPATNKHTYKKRTIKDFDDPWTEILNPYDVFIDDMAKPQYFARDWWWRKVYSMDDFKFIFSSRRFRNAGRVGPGGDTNEYGSASSNTRKTTKDLVEVKFYENTTNDEFHIMANHVLLTPNTSPLPYMHKRLSCFYNYWTLRNTNTIYGVGLPEAMRGNNKLMDLILNMSIDQLVLSIYKMYFYSPANDFSEDQYVIEPGKGLPTNDPKAIQFLEIPGPGQDPPLWLDRLEKKVDDVTGVTKTIGGEALGKTAFEARQNLEAGLRRLKFPLRNIEQAFEVEGNLRLDMIQQVYSVPRSVRIIGEEEMAAFEADRKASPKLYFTEDTEMGPVTMRAEYKTASLPYQRNIAGGMEHSETDQLLELTPDAIRYEGELLIKPMSTLIRSPELEAEKSLRIYNLLAQNPYTDLYNATKRTLIKNQEAPKDWLMSEQGIIQRQKEAETARALLPPGMEGQEMGPAAKVTRDQNTDFKSPTAGVLSQMFSK